MGMKNHFIALIHCINIQVKKNIQAFGGNPNQVTIFGESAGAWSVSYHILSPLSKGLFKNAIIQSGSIYTDASFMSKTQNLKDSKEYSEKLGCKDETNWIKCLKQLDPQQINDYNIDFGKFVAGTKFLPVFGEEFYPIESYEAVKTGKFNSDINILAGITADEGTIFVHKWFAEIDSDPTKFNQNVKNYLNIILKFWKNLESGNERRNVIEAYISDEKDVNNIKSKVGQIFGDYVLTCPTYYFSRDIVLWSGFSNVYMYELTYKSSMSFSSFIAPSEPWIGIGHGDDIEFVFGTSLLAPQRYSQQDYNFALLVMNLWTNFAKTG